MRAGLVFNPGVPHYNATLVVQQRVQTQLLLGRRGEEGLDWHLRLDWHWYCHHVDHYVIDTDWFKGLLLLLLYGVWAAFSKYSDYLGYILEQSFFNGVWLSNLYFFLLWFRRLTLKRCTHCDQDRAKVALEHFLEDLGLHLRRCLGI